MTGTREALEAIGRIKRALRDASEDFDLGEELELVEELRVFVLSMAEKAQGGCPG